MVRVEKDNESCESAMGTDMMLCRLCWMLFPAQGPTAPQVFDIPQIDCKVFDDTRGAYNGSEC
jgi:hypothetical protein